jgi:hypothetical protein
MTASLKKQGVRDLERRIDPCKTVAELLAEA